MNPKQSKVINQNQKEEKSDRSWMVQNNPHIGFYRQDSEKKSVLSLKNHLLA